MKKVMIICLLLAGVTLYAQPPKDGKRGPRKDLHEQMQALTSQQRAELKTKKMTLDLDLTAKQQSDVQRIHLEIENDRAQRMAERKGKKEPTPNEFFERTSKMLDTKIAMKKKFQAILTEVQFEKFERSHRHKERERRHHVGSKKR